MIQIRAVVRRARAHIELIEPVAHIDKMGGNFSAMDPMEVPVPDLDKLLQRDGYLNPYEREIRRRLVHFFFYLFSLIAFQ